MSYGVTYLVGGQTSTTYLDWLKRQTQGTIPLPGSTVVKATVPAPAPVLIMPTPLPTTVTDTVAAPIVRPLTSPLVTAMNGAGKSPAAKAVADAALMTQATLTEGAKPPVGLVVLAALVLGSLFLGKRR